ncbi:peroxiredoxin-like family protein [Mangrovimonas sp. ST2L15]|uniref:peroxiredoxin-like family protein n=1 Tax=Mangrovimonas sp. ST2L15 TaxID=1645916 RepID=UPI0009E8BCC8|nr:peroxiredoxin-like family protein [Mangrovimonas sp. ST2L15]
MKTSNILTLGLFCIIAFSCKNSTSENNTETTETNMEQNNESKAIEKTPTLSSQLEERKENFEKKADDTTKKIYQEGLDAVAESGILESAKNVGDKAPNFTLKNALGEDIRLEAYLNRGPVVLTWYRGGWCPYCNLTLQHLQQELPKFKEAGAQLLALTPELPDQSISTKEKHQLEFEVLSDIGNKVAKDYGVVFKLTDEVANIYNQKFDLNGHNGDESNELPLAATYVINTDGTIAYAFLDSDYRNRAEPSEITAFLKSMNE